MFDWMQRRDHDAALKRAEIVAEELRQLLQQERAEVKRLTNIMLEMKAQGMGLPPDHQADRWPGGSYAMDDVEHEIMVAGDTPEDPPYDDGDRIIDENYQDEEMKREIAKDRRLSHLD